jgi:hypothetical protein
MNIARLTIVFALLTTCLSGAQSSASGVDQNARNPATQPPSVSARHSGPGTQASDSVAVIPVQLSKSLDAKKLNPGDPVEAKTAADLQTENGMVIPEGSTVKGHITEAAARSKGAEQSSLGIAFDNIVLKDGQHLPLKVSIQTVGAPPDVSNVNTIGAAPPMSAPGGSTGSDPTGGRGLAEATPSSSPQLQMPTPQQDTSGSAPLTPQSTGVVGIPKVELQPNSILTSREKDLKLGSGTEMILRVQTQ